MAQRTNSIKPWHEVVELRDDLKSGELSLAIFAADLYDVVMQRGQRPVYEDPAEFFALTYPTYNLRELVKDVCLRLAGRTDKAYRKLSVNYGGGKTHTLIALRHLVHDPDSLPDLPAIKEFEAHIGSKPPKARVAALCFDKIDTERGQETLGPDGSVRMLKYPWSILAFHLAGADGLRLIHAEGRDEERDSPPAEPLVAQLLSKPQEEGLSTLVLLDEVLMYLRGLGPNTQPTPNQMVNFFQYLTQAAVKVDRCAMVASLLASELRNREEDDAAILADVSDVFGRQMEETVSPVSKDDVAEVLRRRFFKADSIRDHAAFRPHVTSIVGNIAGLDEQTNKGRPAAEERYLASYPFHPDLTDVFYSRWTQLDGFQRTRGILRTFAIALRDASAWDTNPLVGPNVFLREKDKNDLAEAVSELAISASAHDDTGGQQWGPILEGELAKARTVQSETTALRHREIEQAVVSVFLSSQPIGQKALTNELLVLIGAANPDRIELEKALLRWTEVSWFLDDEEVAVAEAAPDGTQRLPRAWRLGNRPNLRQMHDHACANSVQPAAIEAQLIELIGKQNSLIDGASAAGARVHKLPDAPRDIQDDGEFHYAVLGPKAASESGKPSSEAKRFVNETTAADRPRVNRNALTFAVPSKDGIELVRRRIREHLGWLEVREMLKGQTIDPVREQKLNADTETARKRIPEVIKQAYSVVITVSDDNEIHAFRIAIGDEPLFTAIKRDRRARIQETAISSEALLPGGPYDLWRDGESSRRVKDLVGAFAQNPKLPKMLRQKEILDTVLRGVRDGIWVASLTRPDRTVKTFWRAEVDEQALKDPALEVFLPEHATLSDIDPALLRHGTLPGLWSGEEITVTDVTAYFAGGHTVTVPQEGYDDTIVIPKCEPQQVEEAISEAVQQGFVWITSGPATFFKEPMPDGVLGASAVLRPPPKAIDPHDLMEEAIPSAWKDGKANALAISTAISAHRGVALPWDTVKTAINSAVRSRWIATAEGTWPCEYSTAQHAVFQRAQPPGVSDVKGGGYQPSLGVLHAEATLELDGIQDLADRVAQLQKASVGTTLKVNVRFEVGGDNPPTPGGCGGD